MIMEILYIWIICPILGYIIGRSRGRGDLGAFIGILFGPLVIIFAFLIPQKPKCPYCFEFINEEATKCPYCRSEIIYDDDR